MKPWKLATSFALVVIGSFSIAVLIMLAAAGCEAIGFREPIAWSLLLGGISLAAAYAVGAVYGKRRVQEVEALYASMRDDREHWRTRYIREHAALERAKAIEAGARRCTR